MGDHSGQGEGHGSGHEGGQRGFRIGNMGSEGPGPHGDKMGPLREALIDLGIATKQVAHNATPDQKAEALKILLDARKAFYGMLAG